MKKEFIFDELMSNRGCYSEEDVVNVFGNFESITLIEILNSKILLQDKRWFLYHACDLTLQEQKDLCYLLVEAVIPVYNKKYPKDDRINDCIKAIKDFNNELISEEELLEFRKAVNDIFETVTGTANAVVHAVNAAALAICTVDAAFHSVNSTVYAVNAAAHSNDESYKDKLLQIMIDFVNNN